MGSEANPLHIIFFPFLAPGHIIPMVDMAKLFAKRGVKVTIVTTPANSPLIHVSIDRANESNHHRIETLLLEFPSAAAGLPQGCENVTALPTSEMRQKFMLALPMLREPFGRALKELLPDCIITDSFLPWTLDSASQLGIPRLAFQGINFFSHCVFKSLRQYELLESLPSDAESVVLPGLPHRIEMLKSQLPDLNLFTVFKEIFRQIRESEERSYGVVVNSFYELEPDYVQHFRNAWGIKAWGIGPVSLCNNDIADKAARGYEAAIGQEDCLKWLGDKKPGSVVYVSFGSIGKISTAQLRETALGLEASGHPFIWVVKKGDCDEPEWLPEGYEERIEGKGLIIRGWAAQILILNHPAVGGSVTHCGWNSSLECISAGLPVVTWPRFAEQFYNERLIVDVLRTGVAVEVKKYAADPKDAQLVTAAEIEMAVARLMGGGEEAEGMRRRARELGEMAERAVEEAGSSYIDMGNLIQELIERRSGKGNLEARGRNPPHLESFLGCVL